MNVWQITRQLRYLLLSRNWSGSSNRVFPIESVVATVAAPKSQAKFMRVPMVFIFPSDGASDPWHSQEPGLLQQSFVIKTLVAIPGDTHGENAMIGANVADRTLSEGRGVLEIEEELYSAIERLTVDSGIVIQNVALGSMTPILDEDLGYIMERQYTFQAICTSARYYPAPINFVATGGTGQVALSWIVPADRYDRFRVVLRRASGGTPPATVSDGTGVTLSGNLAASVTDSGLAAGSYSYSLFAQYDETNDAANGDTLAQADRTSSAITRQSVAVS